MNIPFKHKILFALLSGVTFTILNSLIGYFLIGEELNWIKIGFNFIFFGFFFGFGFLYISQKLSNNLMKKIEIQIDEDEIIRKEGPANLLRGTEGVGGKLLLTNKRLVFKSHKWNVQSGEFQLTTKEIKEVIPRKTANLFQNGIRIKNNADEHFDFVLYERDSWLMKIKAPQHHL